MSEHLWLQCCLGYSYAHAWFWRLRCCWCLYRMTGMSLWQVKLTPSDSEQLTCCAIWFVQLSTFASLWPPVAPRSVHLSTHWNLFKPQHWDRTQYSMQPASVPQLQLKLLWLPNMHWISYDDDGHYHLDVQILATIDCAAAADSHDRYAHYSAFNEKTSRKLHSSSAHWARVGKGVEWLKSIKNTLAILPSATRTTLSGCRSLTKMLQRCTFLRASSASGNNAMLPASQHFHCDSSLFCNRLSMQACVAICCPGKRVLQ